MDRFLRRSSVRVALAGTASVALAFGAASCGADADSDLSQPAQQGKNTANNSGCASCHGSNGQGGVGPKWIDLAGSEVELADGSTVVADEAYLLRSILDPQAELVAGSNILMPDNQLSEAEAADIVTYIQELTSDDSE